MRSAGIKPHMHKAPPIRFRQYAVGQRRFFDALALFGDNEGFVFEPVVEQQIVKFPGILLRPLREHSQIFLLEFSLLNRL